MKKLVLASINLGQYDADRYISSLFRKVYNSIEELRLYFDYPIPNSYGALHIRSCQLSLMHFMKSFSIRMTYTIDKNFQTMIATLIRNCSFLQSVQLEGSCFC